MNKMPRIAKELSALEVKRLVKPGLHAVGGVSGLHLQITATGARSWILRYTAKKVSTDGASMARRDVGLGGFPDVTLESARRRAREIKEGLTAGIDPIDKRREERAKLIDDSLKSTTFAEVARDCHRVKASEFRNPKHAAQWLTTLESYAFPTFGDLPASAVTTDHVKTALQDIWLTKHETATRVRQRIATVLDYAKAQGLRSGDNPADIKGSLGKLLADSSAVKKKQGKQHFPRVPVDTMPQFMVDLRKRESISAKALEFAILTAARPGNVTGATWSEINLGAALWVIPASRMKAGLKHTVPLSAPAVTLLQSLPRKSDLVFPAPRGGQLTDMALSSLLKKMDGGRGIYTDPDQNNRIATPHGTARSSFKDWSRRSSAYRLKDGTSTSFPDEWGELALAHVNSDATRSAYARDELLSERRGLMEAWAGFIKATD